VKKITYKNSIESLLRENLIKKCPIDHKVIKNLLKRASIDLKTAIVSSQTLNISLVSSHYLNWLREMIRPRIYRLIAHSPLKAPF